MDIVTLFCDIDDFCQRFLAARPLLLARHAGPQRTEATISQELFERLWAQGVQRITKLKRHMKNKLMLLFDKLLLRQWALIECVNDQLKNISQIEHTRHRSPTNGIVNMLAAVAAYTFQPNKPALF